jgi:hypothetical protein
VVHFPNKWGGGGSYLGENLHGEVRARFFGEREDEKRKKERGRRRRRSKPYPKGASWIVKTPLSLTSYYAPAAAAL